MKKTQAVKAIWRSRPRGLKHPQMNFPKKYETFDFVNHTVARINNETNEFEHTTFIIPSKPVPAKFFVTGYLIACDVCEIRKLTILQFAIALFKSQSAWWYGSFLLILKRIGLLDVPDNQMYSINKFTFKIWYGKIKKWVGRKIWHKEH